MRRCFELIVLVGTAGILIATSRAPDPCASETVNLRADTSCGPSANLAVTSTTSCAITAVGADLAGLPTGGSVYGYFPDAGVFNGFELNGAIADGGDRFNCYAKPADAGFTISCTPTCFGDQDAGPCALRCSGTLTPR